MQPKRADRSGWRRRANSDERWELVVSLPNCTQGEVWDALQKKVFLTVPGERDVGAEWEYAVTLAGVSPSEGRRQPAGRSSVYMDRMMRSQGR